MKNNRDYKSMTKSELRDYVLSHRDDEEAVRELMDRSEGKRRAFPLPQSDEEMAELFKNFINRPKMN